MITIPPTAPLPIATSAPSVADGEGVDQSGAPTFLALLAAAVMNGPAAPPPLGPQPEVVVADGSDELAADDGAGRPVDGALPDSVPESAPALPTGLAPTALSSQRVTEPGRVAKQHAAAGASGDAASFDEASDAKEPASDGKQVEGVGALTREMPDPSATVVMAQAARNQDLPDPSPPVEVTASARAEGRPAAATHAASSAPVVAPSRHSVAGAMAAAVLAALPPRVDPSATPLGSGPSTSAVELPPTFGAVIGVGPSDVDPVGGPVVTTASQSADVESVVPQWEGVRSATLGVSSEGSGAFAGATTRSAESAAAGTAENPSVAATAAEAELPANVTPKPSEHLTSARNGPRSAPVGPSQQDADSGAFGNEASPDTSRDAEPKASLVDRASSDEGGAPVRAPWVPSPAADHVEMMAPSGLARRQDVPPPAPAPIATSHVTVELDAERSGAQRVRVAIRGDVVNATVVADASAVEALRPQLRELRQALEGHGFREANVQLRTVGEAGLAAAPGGSVEGGSRVSTPLAPDTGSGEGSRRSRQHANDHQPPRDSGHPEQEEERP